MKSQPYGIEWNFRNVIEITYKKRPQLVLHLLVRNWMFSLQYQEQDKDFYPHHFYLALF